MPVVHKNRKGDTYYLHQGKSKKGNPKFFFSRKSEGDLVQAIPEGYEIYENPNAQVFLRKLQPRFIRDDEKSLVEKEINKLERPYRYTMDVKGKVITVFESVQDQEILRETFEDFLMPKKDIRAALERITSFMPVLKFILVDDKERTFRVERFCFLGSVDDWMPVGGTGSLRELADKYIPLLGQDSFYELF